MDPAEPRLEPRLVLGTAGHIDHGKTALIGALTGVDTDRLPEEKARGITIDLGFAPLDLDGTRVGVVDVPGHEALVRTMVAGATGIDLLLLIVAADEGVMPQTREHVAICDLLGIERGVVALTKADLVDEEMCELAAEEVRDLLATTRLRDCAVVPVSSLSGQGIDDLRATLSKLVAQTPPRTPRAGPPRLPVDRAFEIRGFGSVATGTLVGDALAVGDAVELYPTGRRGRIRGLQSHGESTERCAPGARCAVNVQGVSLAELRRGLVVAPPDALAPTHTLDVALRWLDVAPPAEGPTAIALLVGTIESRARVAPIAADRIEPGGEGYARIHVDGEPVAALPGDRFVIRGFARNEQGGATLGGGTILDVAPPHRRRSDPELRRDLERLAAADPVEALRVRIDRSGLTGITTAALEKQTGHGAGTLSAGLEKLRDDGLASASGEERWYGTAALEGLEARLEAALEAFHTVEPLRPGMPSAALRGSLPDNVPPEGATLALTRLVDRGAALVDGDVVRRPDHRPELPEVDRAIADGARAALTAAGLEAPSLRDLAGQLSVAEDHLRDLLAHLGREGHLVRAPGELWFDAAAVEALRERVRQHFASHDTLETPAYKAIIGTTRRTAVPLMELLDDERLTARRGDVRRLRKG